MRASFLFCIDGFLHTRAEFGGIPRLREELYSTGHNNGVEARIEYLPWTSNWECVAKDLSNTCVNHGLRPVVMIAGYSYGGWGSIQLAKEMASRSIVVEYMVLSDPVARPWWLPRPLPAPSSLMRRSWSRALEIPGNVTNLYEFYQLEDRPQGHKLILSKSTKPSGSIRLDLPHSRMDDSQAFHGCVLRCADEIRDLCEEDPQ